MGRLAHLRRRVALFICPELKAGACRVLIENTSRSRVEAEFDADREIFTVTVSPEENGERVARYSIQDAVTMAMNAPRKGVVRS